VVPPRLHSRLVVPSSEFLRSRSRPEPFGAGLYLPGFPSSATTRTPRRGQLCPGACAPPAATRPRRAEMPPCRLDVVADPKGRHGGVVRASRLCSTGRCAPRRPYARSGCAPLFRFLLLRVLPLSAVKPGYPGHPLVVLAARVFLWMARAADLQRLVREKPGCSVSRVPTRSRFRAVRHASYGEAPAAPDGTELLCRQTGHPEARAVPRERARGFRVMQRDAAGRDAEGNADSALGRTNGAAPGFAL
jgi:hypothetical protein